MNTNDPRITAYALGELSGKDREAFEREMAGSDALQEDVRETADLAGLLRKNLMKTENLDPETRKELLDKCAANQAAHSRKNNIIKMVVPISLAAAACLLFIPPLFEGGRGASGNERSPTLAWNAGAKEKVAYAASIPEGTTEVAESREAQTAALYADASVAKKELADMTGNPNGTSTGGTMPTGRMLAQEAMTVAACPPSMDILPSPQTPPVEFNTEAYNAIKENTFLGAKENPLSTFSIDVDTASYSNVRRFLRDGVRPPNGAVRTEELINYFQYNYPQPGADAPFSVNIEMSRAPWDAKHELVRIGLKGRDLPAADRPQANLVFLVDVSGSMDEPNKLPLLKRSLRSLVENLAPTDHVAIVTYAGGAGLALPSTPGSKKTEILQALDSFQAGGSTQGSAGIKLAYETAQENLVKGGINRVILCTDGDFNVGTTSQSELEELIEKERASGVFLSVLGFGTGNVKDSTMELLADKGNGNYAYIDSATEGRKVLVDQMGATLFTIAKDVKIQVEFNPAKVAGYRLIGYENRMLAKEDFNNDKKDAGEIGAGHTVTALYEIIPAGQTVPGATGVDPLKYQKPSTADVAASETAATNEILTVKLRYKEPTGDTSKLIEIPFAAAEPPAFESASADFRFASAVAAFGMKLRNSPDSGDISWDQIQKISRGALGEDPGSYRAEFLTLVELAKKLAADGGKTN